MATSSPQLEDFSQEYERVRTSKLVNETRVLAPVAALMFILFWIVDFIATPNLVLLFLFIRLFVAMLCMGTFALTFTSGGRHYIRVMTMMYITLGSLAVSLMAAYSGGFSSPYYVGNMLIIFGSGLFMSWRLSHMICVSVSLVLGYFLINAFMTPLTSNAGVPIFFLVGASLLASIAVHRSDIATLHDLVLSKQLRTANDELQAMDSLKTDFFANISHELRTPLTLSLGPIESMLAEESEPVRNRQLSMVRRNQLRLLTLINNLLDFSKLEAGKIQKVFTPTDLSQRLSSLAETAKIAAEVKGVTLNVMTPESTLTVYVDRSKFDKIVMNLLSNAFKFTEPGGHISAMLSATSTHAQIQVTDTGIGIPKDKQRSIFDRFSQVDASATRKYAGTGIGLAMVKEYAELHGGTAKVDSEEGKGATFIVSIPLGKGHLEPELIQDASDSQDIRFPFDITLDIDPEEEEPELNQPIRGPKQRSKQVTANSPSTLEISSGHPTVLVVDDSRDMRTYIKNVLANDYEVITAKDGSEGLRMAELAMPDVIVSDVMMPRMSGEEMCRRLKALPGILGQTPIILVTARTDAQTKFQSLDVGADDYLYKPFNALELLLRVRNLADKHRKEIALYSAYQILESDIAAAGRFQHSLIPSLPTLPWLELTSIFRPMDLAGGDFYDVTCLSDTHLRFFVADVTGHGVQAAMRTGIIKSEYDRLKLSIPRPRAILSELNRIFFESYRDHTAEFFISSTVGCDALCGDIFRTGAAEISLRLSSASQAQPIQSTGERISELKTRSVGLGCMEDVSYTDQEFSLTNGDRLYVFTDGLTEQKDATGERFGTQRLLDMLNAIPRQSTLEDSVDLVLQGWEAFRAPVPVGDDLTLLSLGVM